MPEIAPLSLDKYKAELLLEALADYLLDADREADYFAPCNEMVDELAQQVGTS